jgi:hypothetical protein
MSPLRSRRTYVVAAVAIVIGLAVTLLLRLAGGSEALASPPVPPAAEVPVAAGFELADLEIPCWGCGESSEWPVRSVFDLDRIAPLGTGTGNAAVWLRDFAKVSGRRAGELEAVRARMRESANGKVKVLPGDDPFLLEAEPWADQATMRFYPELLAIEGIETEVPDLLIALSLAKSWVARGRATDDAQAAMDDFRRTIRWGRLLRQEDVTIIADLVGLACVRIGLEAVFERASAIGDAPLALAASIAVGEIAPQRLLTFERVHRVAISPGESSQPGSLDLTTEKFEALAAMAESEPDRRFRGEATIDLGLIVHLGAGEQQARAREILERLSGADDTIVVALARWALAHRPSAKALQILAGNA